MWLGVAIGLLVIAPAFYPKAFKDPSHIMMVGGGALVLSLWNFLRWWSTRRRMNEEVLREEMREAYQLRMNPPKESEEPKPILHPEFSFEDPPKLPPPSPPNGTHK